MFTSLRQKLLALLVLPVACLMAAAGLAAFFMTRDALLERWRDSALLSLEGAAHGVDMRLGRVIGLVELLGSAGPGSEQGADAQWLLERLRAEPGVLRADIAWLPETGGGAGPDGSMGRGRGMGAGGMPSQGQMRGRRFHRTQVEKVDAPRLDTQAGQRTVTLSFALDDEQGRDVGRLNAVVSFDHLMGGVQHLSWWKSRQAFLVSLDGRVLASREDSGGGLPGPAGDPFVRRVIGELERVPSGALFGEGHPPDMVAGFYRLSRAPWSLLLFARGREILAPIIAYRDMFFQAGAVAVLVIAGLIWLLGGRLVSGVRRVSTAAEEVAAGRYGQPLPPAGRDEVGRLVQSFNAMLAGLKERDLIRNTFGRYVDPAVARRLLGGGEAIRMGGRRRTVAVVMSDVRGFTPLLESLSPEQSISLVNRMLAPLIEAVQAHGGVIVDFLGDAVLAFFEPLDQAVEEAAARAVASALAMQEAAAGFNRERRPEGAPEVMIGVGVHLGEVVVGNIGSEARTKYGIVGAPVNYTQRLESAAGAGQVVASEAVARALGERLAVAGVLERTLKGVEGTQTLYLVAGLLPSDHDGKGDLENGK